MKKGKRDSFKIAMLGHKTMPARDSSRGGVEVVVEELSVRMAEQGHDVTCYNRTGCDNGGLEEYKGVRLKSVFTIHKKGLAAMTSSLFSTLCVALGNYDIVHFHAEGPCAMLWLAKLFGKRCIVTIHGLDWQREKWYKGWGAKYIKFGERMAVKYADEIIVLSEGVQAYFKDVYGRDTVFIPNGVSKQEAKEAIEIKEKFGLEKDDYLLYLGRIVPEKGLRYLIEAYKRLNTSKRLVIAGESSDTDAFVNEIYSKARTDERIIFTGFVTGRTLEELYSNAYIYALPSDLEGMSLGLLEAMSYGNCCVVSDIDECASVVEDKAVVFKKGSVEDLRDKLQLLCDNAELVAKYKSEAADFICRKDGWDEVTSKTLELYEGRKERVCKCTLDNSGTFGYNYDKYTG